MKTFRKVNIIENYQANWIVVAEYAQQAVLHQKHLLNATN